jgi:ankyrin repeat protein
VAGTDLHVAAAVCNAAGIGDVAEVRRLVAAGADVNQQAWWHAGARPLHLAAGGGQVEMVQVLVEELGADKESTADGGRTALHTAAYLNQVETAKMLCSLGADKEAADDNGRHDGVAFCGSPGSWGGCASAGGVWGEHHCSVQC